MSSNKPEFSPSAWQKYMILRDKGKTEISAMGVCFDPDHPLRINDLFVPHQTCSGAYTEFDDDALSDAFELYGPKPDPNDGDELIGMHPYQFSRIWLHTHPGSSASPSGTDHTTFKEEFGPPEWAVMFILARGGQTHCELKVRDSSGLVTAHVEYKSNEWVNWNLPSGPVDLDQMDDIYKERVKEKAYRGYTVGCGGSSGTTISGKPGYYSNGVWTPYNSQSGSKNTSPKREPLDFGDIEWQYKREDYLMRQYLQQAYVDIKTDGDSKKIMNNEEFLDIWSPDEEDWKMWMDERWLKAYSCKIEFTEGEKIVYECDGREAQDLVFNTQIEDTDFGESFGKGDKKIELVEDEDFEFPGMHSWAQSAWGN
jgi:hypothetical protein